MRRKEEMIGVRVSKVQMDELDKIVRALKEKSSGMLISRSGYLRQFIEVGKVLIEQERYDELVSLVEMR